MLKAYYQKTIDLLLFCRFQSLCLTMKLLKSNYIINQMLSILDLIFDINDK